MGKKETKNKNNHPLAYRNVG